MKRYEWILVATLILVTATTLSFAPPTRPNAAVLAAAAPTPTANSLIVERAAALIGSPTAALTATVTPSPSATRTATVTPSATPSPSAAPTMTATPSPTTYPFDTRSDLDRYIYVDQATQHMFIFEHGQLLRDIPCSTGLPDADKYTPAWSGTVGAYWGTFFAFDVYADEAWYLYKSEGSILIHSLPYTTTQDGKVYQDRDALGVRPTSHGCIRISPENAQWLTNWNPEGVAITVSDPYLDKWRK